MADRPILFSAPMIRALLAGTKTQTRRLLPTAHPRHPHHNQIRMDVLIYDPQLPEAWYWDGVHERVGASYLIPYAPGDRLWVREAHYLTDDGDNEYALFPADEEAEIAEHLAHVALLERDYPPASVWEKHKRLRPSIHLPRWASRLTLTVTEVRVQRLQDISEADARAEGIEQANSGRFFDPSMSKGAAAHLGGMHHRARDAYAALWDSLHGPGSWEANPWVVAVSFDVRKGNIDG